MITALSLLKIYWGAKPSTKNTASEVITEFVTGCHNKVNPHAFISAENYTSWVSTERGLRELPLVLGILRLDKKCPCYSKQLFLQLISFYVAPLRDKLREMFPRVTTPGMKKTCPAMFSLQ